MAGLLWQVHLLLLRLGVVLLRCSDRRLLAEGFVSGGLNFKAFDQRVPPTVFNGYWIICRILRRRVFCEELQGVPEMEFDENDGTCRHIIIQVGDAPVGCLRWRIEPPQAAGAPAVALIDRLCILAAYRGRGFARKAMEHALEDVSAVAVEAQVGVGAVVVLAPSGTMLQAKLADRGFVPQAEAVLKGIPAVRMCLVAAPQQPQAHTAALP
ncbi:hypothetical protein JKP88DRAFT_264942 [Tribonema minus]|uniref:N-acetyltransferase domain-containing protein n=1 Tax=Tribonema minus TaxID=303371 RepID=A0A835YLW0_9STRA|nr:hypothetical protein JKP88DRAFT_264942 [Tribonema minus]